MPSDQAASTEEPQHFSLELEQADVYSKYMLYSRTEILYILRSMMKKNCMATVYFDHGRFFFLTALIAVDDKTDTVIIDRGSDNGVNERALKADRLLCTANLDKVKIQFSLDGVRFVQHGGDTSFAAKLPKTMLRLQRREYFRLDTPQGNPIICQMKVAREDGSSLEMNLPLVDISGGGVGLMASIDAEHLFPIGKSLAGCRIEIPDEGVIQVDLAVRNAFHVTLRNGAHHLRIGCEYIDLPGSRLSMIERYITRVERERKARLSGFD
jgi:c-di-GMP-binding flagellar brake protein YcgR